jgi:hypothetical protein
MSPEPPLNFNSGRDNPERRGAQLPATEGRVDFIVRVPAGVRLQGSMIDGDIEVEGLRLEVDVATIDGNIALNVPSDYNADLYGNTIAGTIDSNVPVYEGTPPLPSGRSAAGPRIARATIGNGGPAHDHQRQHPLLAAMSVVRQDAAEHRAFRSRV